MSGITNPSEKYFKDGLWTFDGSVWRPQNQLLAYRDVIGEVFTDTTADAGLNTVNFTQVPAGEVHVVDSIYAENSVTAACYILAYITRSAVAYWITRTLFYPVTQYIALQGPFVLKASDCLSIAFYNCVLNDTLRAHYVGHKFLIAE